jgi:hypothetical protein
MQQDIDYEREDDHIGEQTNPRTTELFRDTVSVGALNSERKQV